MHHGTITNWGGIAIAGCTFIYLPFGALLVGLAGAIDGVRPLTARIKLPIQIAVSAWTVFGMSGSLIEGAIEVAWIVLVMNAMNLIDGVDGLATGTGIILFIVIAMLTPTPFALTLIGALIGFWCWNWQGKVFLGDSGSYLIGFCLGVATLSFPWSVRLLIFAYPLADVALAFWRRGRNWAQPDKLHIHHRLLNLWPKQMVVARLYVVVLVSTWLALSI